MRTVVTFLVICAITLGIIEAMLRIFPGIIPLVLLAEFNSETSTEIAERLDLPNQLNRQLVVRDDGGPSLWVYAPGQVVTNRFRDQGTVNRVVMDGRGFCNPPEKGQEDFQAKVLAVGDSFTWCTTVHPEDTWPNLLSDILSTTTYNLGQPFIGLYEYLQYLKVFGLSMNANTVVMNVYEGNDLRDAWGYHKYRSETSDVAAGPLVSEETTKHRVPLETSLKSLYSTISSSAARHSYSINLLVASAKLTFASFKNQLAQLLDESMETIDFRYTLDFGDEEVPFNIENTDLDEVFHARALWDGTVMLADMFDAALRDFVDLSRNKGFAPVVTYSPSAYTTYGEYVRFSDPDLEPIMRAYSKMQRDYFSNSADRFGYLFIDLTPALQEAAGSLRADELLYFPTNVHYSATGHRVVANAIAHALTRQ